MIPSFFSRSHENFPTPRPEINHPIHPSSIATITTPPWLPKRTVPKCEHGTDCKLRKSKRPGINCGESLCLPLRLWPLTIQAATTGPDALHLDDIRRPDEKGPTLLQKQHPDVLWRTIPARTCKTNKTRFASLIATPRSSCERWRLPKFSSRSLSPTTTGGRLGNSQMPSYLRSSASTAAQSYSSTFIE